MKRKWLRTLYAEKCTEVFCLVNFPHSDRSPSFPQDTLGRRRPCWGGPQGARSGGRGEKIEPLLDLLMPVWPWLYHVQVCDFRQINPSLCASDFPYIVPYIFPPYGICLVELWELNEPVDMKHSAQGLARSNSPIPLSCLQLFLQLLSAPDWGLCKDIQGQSQQWQENGCGLTGATPKWERCQGWQTP